MMEAARGTLSAATVTAAQLPGPVGAALLEVARGVFIQGMQLTAAIAAAAMIGALILAAVMLRRADGHAAAAAIPDLGPDRAMRK